MADRSRVRRVQAVVLRRRDYGDADRIISVLTPDRGKQNLIAKGIRKTTSRKAGHLELFTHAALVVAQARTWDIVTEATTVESFRSLRSDLDQISRASYAVELIDTFGEAADDSQPLWDLLLLVLRELDAGAVDPDLLLRWFELHLLSLAGYQPQLFDCLQCGEPIQAETNFLSFPAGGIYCPRCGTDMVNVEAIHPDVLKILRHLQRSTWVSVRHIDIRTAVLEQAESILYRYLVSVLERQLKSVDFLRRLRRITPSSTSVSAVPAA